MTLKSTLFKDNEVLIDIAEGNRILKKGDNEEAVKLIQEALLGYGFDLGSYGADGDFGKTTEKVIKSFQSSFTPTYVHHQGYSIGPSDGIVGKGTYML